MNRSGIAAAAVLLGCALSAGASSSADLSTIHACTELFPGGAPRAPRMQGVYNGRTFNFTNVNNVNELNRELEIMATEVVS